MPTRSRLNLRFRADHVGSLLRPAELVAKRSQFEAGECTLEELKQVEDEAIPEVLRLQKDVGLQVITDGEMRRGAFYQGMFENLDGMETVVRPLTTFKSYIPYVAIFNAMGIPEYPSIYCKGKIQRTKGVHTEDFTFIKNKVLPEDVQNIKITVCGPTWMHLRHGSDHTYNPDVYQSDDDYFEDLIKAYREEIVELYYLGCRNIQFDDPTFCFFCADSMIAGMKEVGIDPEDLLSTYIRVYNEILKDRPADLSVSLHTCRGNFKGMHYCEGGYARIAAKLFQDLGVDGYYLEFDDHRSGDFAPLKYLPEDKFVVLGLISSKNGNLETIAEIKSRVEEAVEVISQGTPRRSKSDALNQICISPQCGFASVYEGNPISEEDEKRKLGLVVEAAKQIWE